MRFLHRIVKNLSNEPKIVEKIREIGFVLKEGDVLTKKLGLGMFVAIECYEDDKRWKELASLMKELKWKDDDVSSVFSNGEMKAAKWLRMLPSWHHGYPQPEDGEEKGYDYLTATYDLKNYCDQCRMGKIQKAPFQMKGEPIWGKKEILQLNWVFDEYFCTPELYRKIFKPFEVKSREVIQSKNRKELKTVLQLVINDSKTPMSLKGYPVRMCEKCERKRYLNIGEIAKGLYPGFQGSTREPIFKTLESFGTDQGIGEVIISQELFQSIEANGTKGASFKPIGLI